MGLNDADNVSQTLAVRDYAAAVERLMGWMLQRIDGGGLIGVGHRVVHGGARYREAQRVTPGMVKELRHLSPFDPTEASRVTVRVIRTDEEMMIAGSVFQILSVGLHEGQ